MTVQTVAGTPGSSGRPLPSAPIAGGPRPQLSAVTDVLQDVMYVVTQALTDDDSAGQG